jgi:hypothetical protein
VPGSINLLLLVCLASARDCLIAEKNGFKMTPLDEQGQGFRNNAKLIVPISFAFFLFGSKTGRQLMPPGSR